MFLQLRGGQTLPCSQCLFTTLFGRSPFGLRSSAIVLTTTIRRRRPPNHTGYLLPRGGCGTIQGIFRGCFRVRMFSSSQYMWEMPRGCHVAATWQFGSSRVEVSTNLKLPRGVFCQVSTVIVTVTVTLNVMVSVTISVTVTVNVTVSVTVTVNVTASVTVTVTVSLALAECYLCQKSKPNLNRTGRGVWNVVFSRFLRLVFHWWIRPAPSVWATTDV